MSSCHLEDVVAIIPAYNEELSIQKTLLALKKSGINRIVVIDDGSSDGTWVKIIQAQVKGVKLPTNLGKAGALACGVKNSKERILLFCDSDLGSSAVHLKKLVEPIFTGQADMVVAAWPSSRRGGFGLVTALARWAIKRCTGFVTKSPLSGQRALKREVWELSQKTEGFGLEVALTIDALKKGFTVLEMELPLRHREWGKSIPGFIHRGRQFIHICKALWARRGWLLVSKD